MATAEELIERAFARLTEQPGFVLRADQLQLAMLLGDMIGEGTTGAIEAPTGLGKSLAALIPAIAHAIANNKRTVIATYTNVLAEQYWRRDLPFALTLFEGESLPKTAFLIGRQRYTCLSALEETHPDRMESLTRLLKTGIETEVRESARIPSRDLTRFWQDIQTPAVCPGRLCPHYMPCYYYKARREAEKALVVITNHSVIIQDALMGQAADDGIGMLGKFDFLILDEAHDFPQAAQNGLEFELSATKVAALAAIATRLEKTLAPIAERRGDLKLWLGLTDGFRRTLDGTQRQLVSFGLTLARSGILSASPETVMDHPQVKQARVEGRLDEAQALTKALGQHATEFVHRVDQFLLAWRDDPTAKAAIDGVRNYTTYLREVAGLSEGLFTPSGVSVSHASQGNAGVILRRDLIGLAEPLTNMIWSRQPYAVISATLALDGNFDFFRRTTGINPHFREVLPSPFDFEHQAALYLPEADRIPDPATARKEGREDDYFNALAREIRMIIESCDGRTLVLFHSRREMEEVRQRIVISPDYPILMQLRSGAGAVGEKFVQETHASLFALRSFWTGFDAPGETLSCVVVVRVPFEVPVDPPQIARLAWMQSLGLDAFREHTLPLAKMMMRQGAGRLIRRAEDRGIIALLDPRLRSKRYGEEILANLPPEMRSFTDIRDAVGWIGLTPRSATVEAH